MDKSLVVSSPFDSIRQMGQDGREYWSARDLQKLLGYVEWRKFEDALDRAKAACTNSGHDPSDNFVGAAKVIKRAKRGEVNQTDYHLTRYACYLIAMNGDPRKPEIAVAQTYFAMKTREAEIKEVKQEEKKHPLLLAAPNEIFLRRQKENKWLGEVKRFTIHEKVHLLALSGILEDLDFADNSFLENSLSAFFKPWCEEQGYDVSAVRFSKKPYLVVYEVNKDGSYNWDRPIYRQIDSYPVIPFEMAWPIFLVDFYWPQKFLPYMKRKYKGEERATNTKAAIRVISFFTGLAEEEILARQKKRP